MRKRRHLVCIVDWRLEQQFLYRGTTQWSNSIQTTVLKKKAFWYFSSLRLPVSTWKLECGLMLDSTDNELADCKCIGALHSIKNSENLDWGQMVGKFLGKNFREFEGCWISKKQNIQRKVSEYPCEVFRNFQGIPFHLTFLVIFPDFWAEWFAFRIFNHLQMQKDIPFPEIP